VLAVPEPPKVYELALEAGPSPGRGAFRIEYALPAKARVRLEVFDLAGRRVATLEDGIGAAGPHGATWEPRAQGEGAGVYFLRLRYEGRELVRRVVSVR